MKATRETTAGRAATMRQVVLERGSRTPILAEAPRPVPAPGEALVRTLLVGLDATDAAVASGEGGDERFPRGEDALVLGHECLGDVVDAPHQSGLRAGDRVVPLVRHGCGRCALCGAERADLCATGAYVEHGIRALHGFLRDAWTDDPRALVRVPPGLDDLAVLTEPLSIVVKAVEVAESVQRARLPGFEAFAGSRALLAGTGSLGTLAAFLLRDAGVEVHAFDRSDEDAASTRLLRDLGVRHFDARETDVAAYAREHGGFDVVLEQTGAPEVAFESALALREGGVAILLGVPPQKPAIRLEADDVMRALVLGNRALVGSVNSSRRHVEAAMEKLARFHERWPALAARIVTHRYAAEDAPAALARDSGPDVIKKVVDWAQPQR